MERKTWSKNIRNILTILFLLAVPLTTNAQSTVMEISWNAYGENYKGLLILYSNNNGVFKVKHYSSDIGWVWVRQDATLTNQYDIWGNCTSYINCYNPKVTNPYVIYYADNFVIYPNGQMFTQDAGGTWSTLIVYNIIDPIYWRKKFQEYRIQ